MLNRVRRAFTLIELLVVIAIIAILAAILFPVLAQARMAAKGAASISNMKQVCLANLMYSSDYDDRSVHLGYVDNVNNPFPFNLSTVGNYGPWGWLIFPYTRNGNIFEDPLTNPEKLDQPNMNAQHLYAYRPQYGYAYTVMCPVHYTNQQDVDPTAITSINDPANTVMFSMKKTRAQSLDWLWLTNIPMWMAEYVAPPWCQPSQAITANTSPVNPSSICPPIVRWGVGGFSTEVPSEVDGSLTGGNALRKTGRHIIGWADGSVRPVSTPQLAAGTNWTRTTSWTGIALTDKTKYLWDAE